MSHTPIPFWRLARSAAKSTVTEEPDMGYSPAPLWTGPFSGRFRRRQFVRAAAGTVGGVFAAGLMRPAILGAQDPIVMPNPIPGGFTADQVGCTGGTEVFHLNFPSFPAEDEPSTITDFKGFHGDAHIQGFGTATDTLTGTQTRLFYDADIRFMKGVYIGVDGETHHGDFGFIWVDNYTDSSLAVQVTNIDPGNVPGGLFWTIPIPPDSVKVNPLQGVASLDLANVPMLDFGNFCNDLAHGPAVFAAVSLNARWSGVIRRVNVRNTAEGFAGQFAITNATLEYSASVPANHFEFVSDPASASTNVFAQVGMERNGKFFPEG